MVGMTSRADRKARTRAAILRAARDRFVSQGYGGATIRDVAEAAGVGVGTVHAHFVDKAGLLRACFDDQIAEAVQLGFATLDSTAPLLDQLTHLARVLFAAYARHPALSREMFKQSLFPDAPDPHLGPFIATLAELFRTAREDGVLSRLPGNGVLAGHGWFAAYLISLIGGLAGAFGEPGSSASVAAQSASFRQLMAVQLVGLGACPSLLLQPPETP